MGTRCCRKRPGRGFELDDEAVRRLSVVRGRRHPMWVKYASQVPARPTRVINVSGSDSGGSAGESDPLRTPPLLVVRTHASGVGVIRKASTELHGLTPGVHPLRLVTSAYTGFCRKRGGTVGAKSSLCAGCARSQGTRISRVHCLRPAAVIWFTAGRRRCH